MGGNIAVKILELKSSFKSTCHTGNKQPLGFSSNQRRSGSEFFLRVPEGGEGTWLVEDILEMYPLHLIDTSQSQAVERGLAGLPAAICRLQVRGVDSSGEAVLE